MSNERVLNGKEIIQLWVDCIKIYGSGPTYEKVYEELFELGQAVAHFRLDKAGYDDLAEEIADVYLQLEKLISLHSHAGLPQKVVEYKNQKYVALAKSIYGKNH